MTISISKPELKKLLQDIGGEDRLRAILSRFYAELAADPMVGFFFTGRDLASIAAHQGDFLLRAMGARESFAGKAPAQAHTALPPILPGHFDRRLRILEAVLRAEGLHEAAIQTWVAFEQTFRNGIQAKP